MRQGSVHSRDVDEETPLLNQGRDKITTTPLPWRQFSILLLLQLAEPLTSQSVAPFLPQLIRDVGITHGDESRVGYYVGLMHSLFFLTEACTILHWSRASDQIGRRPVVLTGLFGLSISMYCFGLSRSFWGLVLSRCLNGALNGNIGIIKSMMAEITDSTNIAQAVSVAPLAWFLGTTIGPLIGGLLERPAERFPGLFGNSVFLKKYPYFLPCSIPATFTAICWLIVFFFLKETTKPQMSPKEYFLGHRRKPHAFPEAGERTSLANGHERQLPLRELLVRPVLIAAGSYASLSLLDMALRSVLPVYLATPIELGGLALDPPAIGTIFALVGIINGIVQPIFFAPMNRRFGGRAVFLTGVSVYVPAIALCPIANQTAQAGGHVWPLLAAQMFLLMFAGFAYSVTVIYINASAPNRASIGATNGLAQMVVSIMRAIAPAASNSAFSLSIQKHVMGGYFVYWLMVGMAGIALAFGSSLPRKPCNT